MYDEYEPDPELDRDQLFSDDYGGWTWVYDVPRLMRWRHWIVWDWQWKVAGPFYRFRHHIYRHFRRCRACGKLGCGPEWFSNTCSKECSDVAWKLRVSNTKKLHIQSLRKADRALCGEPTKGIFSETLKIKTAVYTPESDSDQFCSTCLKLHKKAR